MHWRRQAVRHHSAGQQISQRRVQSLDVVQIFEYRLDHIMDDICIGLCGGDRRHLDRLQVGERGRVGVRDVGDTVLVNIDTARKLELYPPMLLLRYAEIVGIPK